jgi:hypothetical protein
LLRFETVIVIIDAVAVVAAIEQGTERGTSTLIETEFTESNRALRFRRRRYTHLKVFLPAPMASN